MCSHSKLFLCQGIVGLHKCANEENCLYLAINFEIILTHGKKPFHADFITCTDIVDYLCLLADSK